MSAITDIRLLPENEAQARPLSRLKDPSQRVRAWRLAVKSASSAGREVTARDAEEAVRRLTVNGRGKRVPPVNGVGSVGPKVSHVAFQVWCGPALGIVRRIPVAHCVVSSPPYYGKRRYGAGKNELGQEKTVDQYLGNLVAILNAIQIHPRGSLWINLADTRGREGLLLVPERFAVRMVEQG